MNYGGEKTWIWPLSKWFEKGGRIWPPIIQMESIESVVEKDGEVVSTTKFLPGFNTTLVKQMALKKENGYSFVRVKTRMEPCINDLVAWSVVQVPITDGSFYVRQGTDECKRLKASDNIFGKGTQIGDTQIYKFHKTDDVWGNKAGFDTDIFAKVFDGELFVLVNRSFEGVDKYRSGEGAQVFIQPNHEQLSSDLPLYVELEFTTPYKEDVGRDVELVVDWYLIKLPNEATEKDIANILESI